MVEKAIDAIVRVEKEDSKKKVILTILILVAIINFVLLVYTIHFRAVVFNKEFYDRHFDELRYTYENRTIAYSTIYYLQNSETGLPDIPEYTLEEQQHLFDVKKRMSIFLLLPYILLPLELIIIIALFFIKRETFVKHLDMIAMHGSGITLLTAGLILVLANNFSLLFNGFHKLLFFPPGSWQFSANSQLLGAFPMQFFYEFAKDYLFLISIFSIVVLGLLIGSSLLRKEMFKKTF
ncbi:DUF1461 domain-containing protein [Candidatus Woesearchaeota archaeon]|nr:DUF1461 domain-containing protein [Candidatus Woesearchaeota archaeon]